MSLMSVKQATRGERDSILQGLFKEWVAKDLRLDTERILKLRVPQTIVDQAAKDEMNLELWAAEKMFEFAKDKNIDFKGRKWTIRFVGNRDLNPPDIWVELTVFDY